MKVTYFQDTDTLFVEFAKANADSSRDLDENTLAEYDHEGNLIAITMEHASTRADLESFSFSRPVQAQNGSES
jgi:uncharacterized protein YuzE